PINIANRLAGVTRKRSIMPLFKSKTINHPAPIPEPNANRTNIPGTNISKTSAVLMAVRDIFFNNELNNKIHKNIVINPDNTHTINHPATIPEPNANRTNIHGTNISKTSAVLMAGRVIFFNNGLNNKIYKNGVINPEITQAI